MDIMLNPAKLIYSDWTITESQFQPEKLHARETVFTIGNGYLSTRGSFEEGFNRAWAVTLIHGVYDEVPIFYTELANCPDWLPIAITLDGERFRLDQGEIVSYERKLDLRRGVLSRSIRWRSKKGNLIDIKFERFASLADEHVLGLRCQITPINFGGSIRVQASINSYVENLGFNHWEVLDQGELDQGRLDHGAWLHVRTRSSRIELGTAFKLKISGTEAPLEVASTPGFPTLETTFTASLGQTVTLEKLVTIYTTREAENPVQTAQEKLQTLSSYTDLLHEHEQAWEQIWQQCDVVIEGDNDAQLAVRYNIFQLLICAPKHDDRVSIAAKTLSGFGYRGHVFWDTEIFILPFFIFTQPHVARNLLTYRYHTLDGARRKAKNYGYKGAMFSWESASTGDEVTPRWSIPNDPYGEDIRIWCRDREIHISAMIAYASWYYWVVTGDDAWMRDYGAEIILESAVFWSSRVELNSRDERYEIHNVIGADEYHEYVSNNAFTNRMAQWHVEKALLVYDWLAKQFPDRASELEQRLQLTPKQRTRWQDIAANLWVPFDASTGLVEQFDGFLKLTDINLQEYEPRTQSMQSILGIEGVNKYQVLKQPDVLMLFYLMRQFQEFPYSVENLGQNWSYYAPRTDITYGSSLGPAIHAILASDVDNPGEAYHYFVQSAFVDLEDLRGNAAEGIHGACAGGVWQAIVFGFGGLRLTENKPVAQPHLPPHWTRLKFKVQWRGQLYEFDLRKEQGVGGQVSGIGEQGIGNGVQKKDHDMEATSFKSQSSELKMTPSESLREQNASDIRGFIFDLDGVLTDTAEFHYRAWQKMADEEGLPFDRHANEALRGVSRRDSILRIIGDRSYTESQLQEMMDRKNRYYLQFVQEIEPDNLLSGAGELLDELRSAGLKIALGSSSKNARMVLDLLGIRDRLDTVSDGNSVSRSKPAPDLFLHAANQLGLQPEQCVVVEDAESGVEAALAAGMWAVGLGPVERVGAAHIVLPSLQGVHWTDLKSKFDRLVQQGHYAGERST